MHLHPIQTARPSGADDLTDDERELVKYPCDSCVAQLLAWRGCRCAWPIVREVTRNGIVIRRATGAELRAARSKNYRAVAPTAGPMSPSLGSCGPTPSPAHDSGGGVGRRSR